MTINKSSRIICKHPFGLLPRLKVITVLILISMWLSNCGTVAPLKQRETSQQNLELAKSVEATQYAEEQFNQATEQHQQGELLIDLEKSTAGNTKAKKNYEDAIVLSEEAYKIAVKPYTEAMIRATEEKIIEAESLKAQKVDSTIFEQSTSTLALAKEKFEAEEYKESKENAIKSKNIIIALIELTKERIRLANEAFQRAQASLGRAKNTKPATEEPSIKKKLESIEN